MIQYLSYQSDFLQNIHDVHDLLIIAAMDAEEKALLKGVRASEVSYGKVSRFLTRQFDLPRCRVTIARSGVGLVNAGILLTQVAEQQPVDAVILLGVGGALDPSLEIGDTVISNAVVQHDSVSSLHSGTILMAPGSYTLSVNEDQQTDPVMRSDSVLTRWIEETMKSSGVGRVQRGTVLSGSEFVGTIERKAALRALVPDALLVDMEAGALAQVARKLNLPLSVAKTVVDRALPASSVADDFKTFLDAATAHSASVMSGLLRTFS